MVMLLMLPAPNLNLLLNHEWLYPMPKLFLKHEGVTLNTFDLEKDKTTIGRNSDNDIQLNDAVASSHHAQLITKPNEYLEEQVDVILEDLGSTNGTLVNDRIIKSVELRDGDDIQIGSHHFIFDSEQAASMDETTIYLPDEE